MDHRSGNLPGDWTVTAVELIGDALEACLPLVALAVSALVLAAVVTP